MQAIADSIQKSVEAMSTAYETVGVREAEAREFVALAWSIPGCIAIMLIIAAVVVLDRMLN